MSIEFTIDPEHPWMTYTAIANQLQMMADLLVPEVSGVGADYLLTLGSAAASGFSENLTAMAKAVEKLEAMQSAMMLAKAA